MACKRSRQQRRLQRQRTKKAGDCQPASEVGNGAPSVVPTRPQPLGRGREVLFAALAVVIGFIVAIVLVEVAMRIGGIQPERYAQPRWQAWHEGRFHDTTMWGAGIVEDRTLIKQPGPFLRQGVMMGEYVPGAKFRVLYDREPRDYFDSDGGVTMQVNSLGLRGPEIETAKASGTLRIVGLGDSFTFGVGVADEHTFLRRLEKSLNAFAAPGRRYEVVNAGVQGYNTRDEVLYLKHRWLALRPDLVLITFYLNDAYRDDAFANMGQALGIYLNRPDGLARWSYLADFAQHAWRARTVRKKIRDYYAKHYFRTPREFLANRGEKKTDWRASRQSLARAAALARSHQFKLALVIFPELDSLDGEYPFRKIHELVRVECDELGIPVLDLLETLRGRNARDLWVHPSDHHPNEVAHQLAAEAIEEFVLMNDLVVE